MKTHISMYLCTLSYEQNNLREGHTRGGGVQQRNNERGQTDVRPRSAEDGATPEQIHAMETKVIYFTVNGTPEQAEFPVDCPDQDVKGQSFSFNRLSILFSFEKFLLNEVCY